MLAITAIEGPEDSHVRAKIGMPSIMDTTNLPDMGRMNGDWVLGERTLMTVVKILGAFYRSPVRRLWTSG